MKASNDNFPTEKAMLQAKVKELVRLHRSKRLQKNLRQIDQEPPAQKFKTR